MYNINDIVNKVHCADSLQFMKQLPDKCVDLVLTDPPYGTTGNKWDIDIDLEEVWLEFNRICKTGFVIFSSQPFTSRLINSNIKNFKYHWIWNKGLAGNGILAKKQPLKIHEEICIFGNANYLPIMKQGRMRIKGGIKDNHGTFNGAQSPKTMNDLYYPQSILNFSMAGQRSTRTHPTEKPLELLKYLVQTYSTEDDIILDPFLGSGTTAVAARQLNRRFIGVELSEEYCAIARRRLEQKSLF